MDQEKFSIACRLRDEGKLQEAAEEFLGLSRAKDTDPLNGALMTAYAARTLDASGDFVQAEAHYNEVEQYVRRQLVQKLETDERFTFLQLCLYLGKAVLSWRRGLNEDALSKLRWMKKHFKAALRYSDFQQFNEDIAAITSFILVDLGHCDEALPILEGPSIQALTKKASHFILATVTCWNMIR
jgi:tetratricopeptide (TPR) repeat protein